MGMLLFWPLTLTLTLSQGYSVTYAAKRIVTKYLCANFGDRSFNSFRQIWQCRCFDPWPWPFLSWPFLPWPSVKATALYMLWRALSQGTFAPNSATIASVVSEKHGNVNVLTFDLNLCDLDRRSRPQCHIHRKAHCHKAPLCQTRWLQL